MGLFDTIKENTNLVRGGSSQPAGKFDQQIRSVYKELHADHETGAADNK